MPLYIPLCHYCISKIAVHVCAAGVEAFEQIEVDMFRMTALYILERLKPSLMAHLLLCFSPMLRRQSSNAPAPAPAPKLTLQRTMQRTNTLCGPVCSCSCMGHVRSKPSGVQYPHRLWIADPARR